MAEDVALDRGNRWYLFVPVCEARLVILPRRALGGYGCWLTMLATCLTTGCSHATFKVADVSGPVREERRLQEPGAPAFRSDWQVTSHAIQGHLTWQSCARERWWTTKRVKTVTYEKYTTTGLAFLGGGAVLTVLGNLTMNQDKPAADNAGPWLLQLSGLVMVVGGIGMLAGKSGTTTETLSLKHEHDLDTGSCLPPRDFGELLFVLKVGHALWPVRLSPRGDARVELPEGASVPPDVDLQLVVFRAPAGASDVVKKGQILETFRLPTAAAGTP